MEPSAGSPAISPSVRKKVKCPPPPVEAARGAAGPGRTSPGAGTQAALSPPTWHAGGSAVAPLGRGAKAARRHKLPCSSSTATATWVVPSLSGPESSSGHRRAARCCAASQPRAHGHGAGESAVNVPLKARGRRDACYSDQLGDRRVCSRRDSLRETERGGDRRWDICFPQLPYSFSLRRGIH